MVLLLLVGVLPAGVTGCAALGPAGEACVDWVTFETPADAAADASAVLLGTVVERDGTERLYGVDAHRWLVDVERVLEPRDGTGGTGGSGEIWSSRRDLDVHHQISAQTPDLAGAVGAVGAAAAKAAVAPGPLITAGERVAVLSTPETCTGGGAYPSGDPLDPASGLAGPDGTVVLLVTTATDVTDGGGSLSLLTPYQGVLTPAADGSLPAEWPATWPSP
ncbi:hypothetical protein APR03_002780 [Promicromonospora thailandica]|uniref:Uncharacterized protein n=2 Tax=Promicromonospora thailandica TaxID=765201 RepID=A0A9X2G243_9MICO|nr:hypothetical protein [Promicromonospora thailandica]